MSSKKLFRWYKDVLSGYKSPGHRRHLQKTRASRSPGKPSAKSPVSPDLKIPILNEKNMGSTICIDEKNINGDCYTIVSNPETNKIVLMVNTLLASQIVYLMRSNISQEALFAVSCVTRDMAPNYDWVARELFPNAYQVADKFHVVKNIIDQVQSVRIRYRQELLRKQRELEEASRKQPKLQPDPKIQRELKDLKRSYPMEILSYSSSSAARGYCTSSPTSIQLVKSYEPSYSLDFSPTSKKRTNSP